MPACDGYYMERISPDQRWESLWDSACFDMFPKRQSRSQVASLPRLSGADMDRYLVSSVVVLEYIGLAASNALLECIVRNTPVVVNKLPAAVEYLGEDYPLYYTEFGEISDCLNKDRIMAAHRYLKALDKSKFALDFFVEQLDRVINWSYSRL